MTSGESASSYGLCSSRLKIILKTSHNFDVCYDEYHLYCQEQVRHKLHQQQERVVPHMPCIGSSLQQTELLLQDVRRIFNF